jgi:predicted transcriptional regulator
MSTKTITFRAPEEKVAALDFVAGIQQRDRSFILNEAVTQYLSLQDYHRELIEEGIREDNAGEVIDHGEVLKMVAGWSRKQKAR